MASLLANIPGIRKSSALCERFSASNSLPAEGQGNSQKIYLKEMKTPQHRAPIGNDVVSGSGFGRTGAIRATEPQKARNLEEAQAVNRASTPLRKRRESAGWRHRASWRN